MLRFECDYNEGAHPRVLEALLQTNAEQTPGYGEDGYCEEARQLIRAACQAPHAAVQFLVGGTGANLTVIASLLRPHQGVLCAATGHIAGHETGAVEATGHKILPLASADGKITAADVCAAYKAHYDDTNREHVVQPGMVYISHPTENGTIYTRAELAALYDACRGLGLPLYIDGARLGYGLAAPGADLTLADIAALCDVFTIGGTKVGALFGEAVVHTNPALARDFRYHIKQRGGMLAKGRLLGLQFRALFADGLYMDISRHAVTQAARIAAAFAHRGFGFAYASPSNQVFPILPNEAVETLRRRYAFHFWQPAGPGLQCVRFCTSWATLAENVDRLVEDIAGV